MMQVSTKLPQFRLFHVLLAVAITLFGLLAASILMFYPDETAEFLSPLSARSTEAVYEDRYILVRDVALIWAIGMIFILFDARARAARGASLLKILFFERPDGFASGERALIQVTLWVSLLLAPILVVVNLGRFTLGTEWLRAEDGPLEYATAIGFLIAAALLAYVALRDHVGSRSRSYRNAALLFAMSLVMFVISFEEISWGQRIIGFETPESLKKINTQDEFNVHNIVTSEIIELYLLASAILFSIACLSFLKLFDEFHLRKAPWLRAYLPDPSLLVLFALILIFSTHLNFNDLVEQLAAIVVVLYSLRLVFFSPEQQRQAKSKPDMPFALRQPGSARADGAAQAPLKADPARAPEADRPVRPSGLEGHRHGT